MSSWFYKLRRKRSAATSCESTEFVIKVSQKAPPPSPITPPATTVLPPPCSECSPNRNRASYYVPSRDRALSPRRPARDNPKLRDTPFPPPSSDIVFDLVARRDHLFDDAMMHGLKLRPILTRPAAADGDDEASDTSSGGAASPKAATRMRRRFRLARASGGTRKTVTGQAAETYRSRRSGSSSLPRWLYESVVVEKESAEPEEDFLASMEEMIAAANGGGVRTPRSMEDLLACYLALNAAVHHRAIVAAFRRAWLMDCDSCVPPQPPPTRERRRRRCHARLHGVLI